MSQDNFNNLSNEKLVELSGKTVVGTPSGLDAQRAQAELTKRLMESIDNLNKSTSRYSDRLLGLTLLLFFIAFIQLIVSLRTISNSLWVWIACIAIVYYGVYRVIRLLEKKSKKKK